MLQSAYYYLCPDSETRGELHKQGCFMLSEARERIFLGSVYTRYQAVSLARKYRTAVYVCPHCLN